MGFPPTSGSAPNVPASCQLTHYRTAELTFSNYINGGDLGIVTPQLSSYGGSEIDSLECVRRWQEEIDITLYTCTVNCRLLAEFGINRNVKVVRLPSGSGRDSRYGILEESLVLPHLWEKGSRIMICISYTCFPLR